jgi:hypothetical protein
VENNTGKQSNFGPISTTGPGTIYLRSELRGLKIIGVEEHVAFPDLIKRIPRGQMHSVF